MNRHRRDPGECLVCGAAHCGCGGGPIEIVQLPARDRAVAEALKLQRAPLVCELVQATLPPGQVTTGTYRRKRTKRGTA